MVKREIDATVQTDFAANGIIWTLDMPAVYATRVEANGSSVRTLELDEMTPRERT
jgi:hypothetical protein